VKKDRYTFLVLIGGLVTLIGLILAFYLQPACLWAVRQEDGSWRIGGRCQKGGVLFRERMREAIRGTRGEGK
jgi:hypothetical protein